MTNVPETLTRCKDDGEADSTFGSELRKIDMHMNTVDLYPKRIGQVKDLDKIEKLQRAVYQWRYRPGATWGSYHSLTFDVPIRRTYATVGVKGMPLDHDVEVVTLECPEITSEMLRDGANDDEEQRAADLARHEKFLNR